MHTYKHTHIHNVLSIKYKFIKTKDNIYYLFDTIHLVSRIYKMVIASLFFLKKKKKNVTNRNFI